MGALYKIDLLKIEQKKINLRISVIHPDGTLPFNYPEFLMEYLILYFRFLKLGYKSSIENIALSREGMQEKAENLQAKDSFLHWEKFLLGEEIPITKEAYEDTRADKFGYNPSEEQYESIRKAKNKLSQTIGVSISGFKSIINSEQGIEEYYAISAPKSLKSVARKIILNIEYGKSRSFKKYSPSKRCYAFEELTFEVSDMLYIEHLYADTSVEM